MTSSRPRTPSSPAGLAAARRVLRVAALCLAGLLTATVVSEPARAQNTYPTPNLISFVPPGGKAGSTFEVTVNGNDLEEPSGLIINHPGIKAEYLPPPPPDPKVKNPPAPPIKLKVAIAPDVPVGIYEVRFVGKWGISNSRAFAVGDLAEADEKEPNSDVPQAQKIELNHVVNGAIGANVDVDYFTFTGKKGQQVLVHCAASSIDSKLNPLLEVFDSTGRRLGGSRNYQDRDALVHAVLPADGDYLIRLCQFTYIGAGPDHYYRLKVATTPWVDAAFPPVVEPGKTTSVTLLGWNLPGGQPVPGVSSRVGALQQVTVPIKAPADGISEWRLDFRGTVLPRTGSINGFEHRVRNETGSSNPVMLGYATAPVVAEEPDNDTAETAQEIPLPCELCARVEKRGDRDWFTFTAKKDEVYTIEGYADRLGSPVDLYFVLVRAENKQRIGEYDEHTEVPSAVGKFYTRTEDPLARVVIPADGEYQLMVASRTGDIVGDPRHVYRFRIQKEEPDFHLVVVANTDVSAGGCTLRQGGSQDLQVVCFRRDGFAGEVKLTVEGLPPKVACPPQTLAGKQRDTVLVLTAARDAPAWAGELTVKGTAIIDGKPVVREARPGSIVWPTPQNVLGISRLAHNLCVAVREKGVYRLDVAQKEITVPVGAPIAVKVLLERQSADLKNPVQLTRLSGPVQNNGNPINTPNVSIPNGKNDAEVKLTLPANTEPGVYNLVFRGTVQLPFSKDPKGRKANITVQETTPPIQLTVYSSLAEVTLAPDRVAVPPGGEAVVVIKVKRLYGYKGEFKVALQAPGGFPVSAGQVTIPAGANEGKLVLKAPANARLGSSPQFKVRLTGEAEKRQLTTEVPLTVAVAKDAAGITGYRSTTLLAAGSAGWKYQQAGKVSGNAWLNVDFNDAGWAAGKAPLGNGEPEVSARQGTTVSPTGEAFHFRREVEVPAALLGQKGAILRLKVASDNSADVYINGQLADRDPEADHEYSYWNRDVELKPGLLRPGRNVVAVRVHNTSGSSDLFMDLEIAAQVPEMKK